jgi:hypothetical protein
VNRGGMRDVKCTCDGSRAAALAAGGCRGGRERGEQRRGGRLRAAVRCWGAEGLLVVVRAVAGQAGAVSAWARVDAATSASARGHWASMRSVALRA